MDKLHKLQQIEELTKDFSLSKYNSLKISYLVRLINDTDHNLPSCEECRLNQTILEEMTEEIPYLDDIEHRQPYETKFNKIRKHFHKAHGYIPPYYFSSRYIIVGLLAGGSIAAIISFLLSKQVVVDVVLAGITIGLFGGYFIGSFRELQFRQSKKII